MTVALGVLLFGSAACKDPDPGVHHTSADFLTDGPHEVGLRQLTLVDPTRPTSATAEASALAERTLPTDVFYPAQDRAGVDVAAAPGPFPLVVIAHGFMGSKTNNENLAALLASHGHVVAAVEFPLTHLGTPGGPVFEDVRFQPGDVRFVIDALLEASAAPGDPLDGVVDPDRVTLIGHSLGAFTVLLAGLHPAERHPAVGAVVVLSGSACQLPDTTFGSEPVPLLVMHGDRDAIIFFEDGAPPIFAAAPSPTWLVTLVEGTHTGFVDAFAELFSGYAHVDSLGCSQLTGELPTELPPEYSAWMDGLGGSVLDADCHAACSDPTMLERGMNSLRQVELMDLTVRAFLQAVRHGDAEAQRFLDETLASENPDLTVQRR